MRRSRWPKRRFRSTVRYRNIIAVEGQPNRDGDVWSRPALQALAAQAGGELQKSGGPWRVVVYLDLPKPFFEPSHRQRITP
jgi:hypothetical protein